MVVNSDEARARKGNLQRTLSVGLSYLKYIRLAVLLFAFSLALGLSYYVFARSVYYSRALLDYKLLGIPIHSESGDNAVTPTYFRTRSLLSQLNSRYLVSRTAERLGLVQGTAVFAEVRDYFVKQSAVSLLDNNTLMIETYPYFPELSVAWPKALVEEYLDYQAKLTRELRERAMERYREELIDVKMKLDESLDRKIDFEKENAFTETFIEQNRLTEVPREMVIVKHRLGLMEQLQPRLSDPGLGSIEKLSLLSAFEKESPIAVGAMMRRSAGTAPVISVSERKMAAPVFSGDVVVVPGSVSELDNWQELEKEQRRLEEELARASRTYLPGHRIVVDFNQQLAEVKEGLGRELSLSIERFSLEHLRLKDRLVSLEDKLPEYREVSRQYDDFRQNYDLLEKGELAWDKAHIELSEKIAAMEFAGEKDRIELRYLGLVELRDNPVSPNKMKLIYASIAIGLALSVFIPFGLEFFNDSSSRFEEVENATGLPGIGLVPLCDRADLENVVRSPLLDSRIPNFLLESFRIIRSQISLNKLRDNDARVIMVSSARPGEGKTTQAANLAWAFSSVGERTILLDTDLRRGRVHQLLGIENNVGMTSVLVGASPWEDAVQTTSVPNLDVLPRGPIIAGATEILCKPTFEHLIKQLRERYDRILLDTPPVLGLSETTSLQRVVDGVVLVIRAEKTPKRDVRAATELLYKAGAHFFGFVLNMVDLTKAQNYYNYYYYSASYYEAFEDVVPSVDLPVPQKT